MQETLDSIARRDDASERRSKSALSARETETRRKQESLLDELADLKQQISRLEIQNKEKELESEELSRDLDVLHDFNEHMIEQHMQKSMELDEWIRTSAAHEDGIQTLQRMATEHETLVEGMRKEKLSLQVEYENNSKVYDRFIKVKQQHTHGTFVSLNRLCTKYYGFLIIAGVVDVDRD